MLLKDENCAKIHSSLKRNRAAKNHIKIEKIAKICKISYHINCECECYNVNTCSKWIMHILAYINRPNFFTYHRIGHYMCEHRCFMCLGVSRLLMLLVIQRRKTYHTFPLCFCILSNVSFDTERQEITKIKLKLRCLDVYFPDINIQQIMINNTKQIHLAWESCANNKKHTAC